MITFSGSSLKGRIVPSSSDVSGSAVRQEQDGESRQKVTCEVERHMIPSTVVSYAQEAE